jgi:cell division protein FtsB/FtsZ-binding cell division protein ZapB
MMDCAHPHQYFEELCAVAAIGQLHGEEQRELLAHLSECTICRQSADEFVYLLGQLPLIDPTNISSDNHDLLWKVRRQRFLNKATAEGIPLSRHILFSAKSVSLFSTTAPRHPVKRAVAMAAGLATAAGLAGLYLAIHVHSHPRSPVAETPIASHNRAIANMSAGVPRAFLIKSPIKTPAVAADNSARQMALLQEQIAQLVQEKAALTLESANLRNEVADLRMHAGQSSEILSAAYARSVKLNNENTQAIATVNAQQITIRELEEKIKLQAGEAERERQLNDAAKDVRQLMGARNLHIIDVHDLVAPDGRDKVFGRVFYAEGKSLIFYAFDLGKKTSSSKVIFQAWGHREGRDFDVKNLGVFRVDHDEQRRWVLRVDNPELLSKIDTLYVTVEPAPGRDKPTGNKLLVAYLGGQPNHP